MQFQQLHLDRDSSVRYLNWGIRFFLSAALTAARLPSGAAPFALGWVAAAGAGGDGIAALAGTGLGAALFLTFDRGLPHLAVAVLLVRRVVRHPLGVMACAMILSGGVGNIVDRVRLGYVVDMFNLLFMEYPVFNVADIFVVCGAVLGAVYYMWFYEKYDKKGGAHGESDAPSE